MGKKEKEQTQINKDIHKRDETDKTQNKKRRDKFCKKNKVNKNRMRKINKTRTETNSTSN